MYKIDYNKTKNRINVSFDEMPYGDELVKYSNDLLGAVNNSTRNGFTILFDMTQSKAKVVSDSDISGLKAAKQYCVDKGMAKCSFAIQSSTLRLQISRFLKDTEPKDGYFETAAEADKFLDE